MFGKAPQLSPLESRKQLLLAESEFNRDQLSGEWRTMKQGVRDLARHAATLAAWTSSAALVAASVSALRRGPPAPGTPKSSWLQKMLKGARAASAIWLAFRARGEKD